MVMTLWIYVNINTPSAVNLRHQSEGPPPRMLQYWIIPKPGYYFELYDITQYPGTGVAKTCEIASVD